MSPFPTQIAVGLGGTYLGGGLVAGGIGYSISDVEPEVGEFLQQTGDELLLGGTFLYLTGADAGGLNRQLGPPRTSPPTPGGRQVGPLTGRQLVFPFAEPPPRGSISYTSRPFLVSETAKGATGRQLYLWDEPGGIIHKNSLDYSGPTHVYRIKSPDGTTYKIGESALGLRAGDLASIRAEQQIRELNRTMGPGYSTEIRKWFPNKTAARAYETRVIQRFRGIYGENTLPGNLTNR